jgi:hypothetical protein
LFAESTVNPTIKLKTAGPILYLNNVTIEAFPSHHLDAMTGYTDPPKPEPEKEKYKVDDAVTVDKKHSNNDIQRSEEDNN